MEQPKGRKQTTGKKRETIDKFYTGYNAVKFCVEKILQNINIHKQTDLVIEPSAGNGAFIEEIESRICCLNNLYFDIEPENTKIVKQDFLNMNANEYKQKYNKIHIIGNPPFGKQSSIAIKFIKKSCEFADSICFILPKSFRKISCKQKIPLNFHLVYETDLPDKSFLLNGKEYDVPCIFQIWEKRTTQRPRVVLLEPQSFEFVKKGDNPDISFRRVGVNAGAIDKNIGDKSVQSHYFIKINLELTDELFTKLNSIKYEFNNTVGPKSISKQELIAKFNPILSQ